MEFKEGEYIRFIKKFPNQNGYEVGVIKRILSEGMLFQTQTFIFVTLPNRLTIPCSPDEIKVISEKEALVGAI